MLSKYQFAVLRSLSHHALPVEHVGRYKDTTLYFLFKRGYIHATRQGIQLTQDGVAALAEYTTGRIPLRKHAEDITDRTARYLRVVRMRKVA